MSFISKSPPGSYRELHTAFHLRTTSENGERNSRVVVLFDPAIAPAFASADEFDLNFMVVEKEDLDRLEAWEDGGMVPPGWIGGEGS